MRPVDRIVETLETVSLMPGTGVYLDADNAGFPHNEAEPYPDTVDFINREDPAFLIIVTANANLALAKQREKQLGADFVVMPTHNRWLKKRLYEQAAEKASELTAHEQSIVIDDRWFAGLLAAKRGIFRVLKTKPDGILVNRQGAVQTAIDRRILEPIERRARIGACALGIDVLIRPRKADALQEAPVV